MKKLLSAILYIIDLENWRGFSEEWKELREDFGTGGLIGILIICIAPFLTLSIALILSILNSDFSWGLGIAYGVSLLWMILGIRGLWK